MDDFSKIIVFILASIGGSHIIIEGKIFESTRNFLIKILPEFWHSLFTCYACNGTYLGFICGWLVFEEASIWQLIACAFAGSFLSALAAAYLNYLESQTIITVDKND